MSACIGGSWRRISASKAPRTFWERLQDRLLARRAVHEEGRSIMPEKQMLEFGGKYCNWGLPETEPIDQAYACLYLASKMGRRGRRSGPYAVLLSFVVFC